MSSNPQQRAAEALAEKFTPNWASYPLAPLSPRGLSAMRSYTESDGHQSIRPLNFGEIVDCLAEAGLLVGSQHSESPSSDEEMPETLLEALRMLANGLTPQQAGRKVGITNQGISMRVRRAADLLGTTTAVHTVLTAYRRGLIEVDHA